MKNFKYVEFARWIIDSIKWFANLLKWYAMLVVIFRGEIFRWNKQKYSFFEYNNANEFIFAMMGYIFQTILQCINS